MFWSLCNARANLYQHHCLSQRRCSVREVTWRKVVIFTPLSSPAASAQVPSQLRRTLLSHAGDLTHNQTLCKRDTFVTSSRTCLGRAGLEAEAQAQPCHSHHLPGLVSERYLSQKQAETEHCSRSFVVQVGGQAYWPRHCNFCGT